MKFTATISRFGESEVFWTSIIIIPDEIYQKMILLSPKKRIVCTLNNSYTFHCAMIPKNPFHYIMLSKEKIKELKLNINDEISVEIIADKSEYGIDVSDEFQEVLDCDEIGEILFKKLTPGKQRSLIYLMNKTKNSNLKIEKCFVILEHLKRNKGILDLELLNQDFKNYRNKQKL
ncbi:hypothetical protein [Flavobacterium sp.]|uniref:hypothetical protein n=1 Tax=Flavobacterium sp. TaxID=239 RepID=UPI0037521DE4